MSDMELADRIAHLEARAAITDLVHRYAHAVRNGDGDEFAKLFTEDATFEVREPPGDKAEAVSHTKLTGGGEIAAHLAKSIASSKGLSPLIHNLLIDINGDEASGRCVMVGEAGAGVGRFIGAYQDHYRRGPDGWRFSARLFRVQSWNL